MNILDSEGMGKVKRAFDNNSKKMFSSNVIPTSLAQMLTLNKQRAQANCKSKRVK